MTVPANRQGPTIEVLYFAGCPNYEALVAHLPQLLDQVGLKGEMTLHQVESEEDAKRSHFLGSPTVRVDGRDVEPDADGRTDYGLKCRLYRTPGGIVGMPPDRLVVDALES